MVNILALLQCLAPVLPPTTLRQFSRIMLALLAMTGRVTMLGISRWTEAGGSYRTVQRFFNTAVDWRQVHWLLIKTHLLQPQATYLLVGDEVVVTKAGHETHGLERFFSPLFGKPVPGLAFFAFALVNVQQRTAHPLRIGQVLRPAPTAEPVAAEPAVPSAKCGRGRPNTTATDELRTTTSLCRNALADTAPGRMGLFGLRVAALGDVQPVP